jgi:hypothetical protein
MHRYHPKDIDALIEKVELGTSLYSKLLAGRVSWEVIADLVLSGFTLEDDEKTKHLKLRFAQAWRRFGYDYVHAGLRDEYNSTKHGMRARPGGFRLLIGAEETPGEPAKTMVTMADSEFGSAYFVADKIVKDQGLHFRVKRHWCNWNPEAQITGLLLAGLSLHNILSFAKTLNGIEATEVDYHWPRDDSRFDSPWNHRLGFAEFNMDTVISAEMIQQYSRDEILAAYKRMRSSDTNS